MKTFNKIVSFVLHVCSLGYSVLCVVGSRDRLALNVIAAGVLFLWAREIERQ